MSQIIKAYMGVFVVLLLAAVSGGILSGYLNVLAAQDMHAVMISELEDSHFYYEVLRDCFRQAEEKGYELTVTLYSEDGTVECVKTAGEIPADSNRTERAEVALQFTYEHAFLQIRTPHVLTGSTG